MDNNTLVLDTHIWIWLINGDKKIKKSNFLPYINDAVKLSGIKIPAISVWEVSMLVKKGRIVLSENTMEWINNALTAPGVSLYPLTPAVSYESTVLPGNFHGDPADRMIVATARILNAHLLTFDKPIHEYAKKGYVKVIKPTKKSV